MTKGTNKEEESSGPEVEIIEFVNQENSPEIKTGSKDENGDRERKVIERGIQKYYPEEKAQKKMESLNYPTSLHGIKKCKGCKRYRKDNGNYEFEKINNAALPNISYLGTAKPSERPE